MHRVTQASRAPSAHGVGPARFSRLPCHSPAHAQIALHPHHRPFPPLAPAPTPDARPAPPACRTRGTHEGAHDGRRRERRGRRKEAGSIKNAARRPCALRDSAPGPLSPHAARLQLRRRVRAAQRDPQQARAYPSHGPAITLALAVSPSLSVRAVPLSSPQPPPLPQRRVLALPRLAQRPTSPPSLAASSAASWRAHPSNAAGSASGGAARIERTHNSGPPRAPLQPCVSSPRVALHPPCALFIFIVVVVCVSPSPPLVVTLFPATSRRHRRRQKTERPGSRGGDG
ncbi:hypothetical protein B0H15DRAFT_488617 [Mycena belliarum]|uniref:Uncharacterized protein n=1 Tax=Mycena belliarum TaxID=1033014 RepID=A0AAD6TUM3_9AGAR|nr:hypothetical protein B0H15DRAFT_488617 [Mycena belliae]